MVRVWPLDSFAVGREFHEHIVISGGGARRCRGCLMNRRIAPAGVVIVKLRECSPELPAV